MEQKNNITNNDFFNYYANKEKYGNIVQNLKKSGIKKYNSKTNSLTQKKVESNNLNSANENKKKQKQIKQCFADLIKTKQHKEKYINKIIKSKEKSKEKLKEKEKEKEKEKSKDKSKEKEKEKEEEQKTKLNKDINKSELKNNKYDNKTKNIKVNKIKIEKINFENINSITNRDFYQKSSDRNKNANCNVTNDTTNIKNNNTDINNQNKKNIICVKSFNKNNMDKDLLNMEFHNSEYINFMNPYNKNTSLLDKSKNNYRYNLSSNTYNNSTTTGKSKISTNSSKILISFKNIKTFYAHLEIFISLYLKRIFTYFIEKIRKYKKPSYVINSIELVKTDTSKNNNYRPIVNVNNAHCSLYCSINLNQDKLFSTIFDNNHFYSVANNTFTPLTKRNEIKNIKQFTKGGLNNSNKRNRILLINPEYDINLSTNKRVEKINNKSVYVPKKKISKSNIEIKGLKINKNNNNNNNENIKSSPIKEMNINLKQINVCRLNDLNQLYLNQNLFKNNSGTFHFSEVNPVIKINNNNNMTNHNKYNSNNIFPMNNNNTNNNNNASKEKSKLKKIQSAKNGIYIKPKENNKTKIKEIKIKNKLSPLKKEIEDNKKNYNNKTDNIITSYNSFNKNIYMNNDNSRITDDNLYTINTNEEINPIKKIYIKRTSKHKKSNEIHLKENLFDSYKKQFYSTFLNFKTNKNINNINNEILIKQIISSDKRIHISIKYLNLEDDNSIKNNKNNIIKKLNKINLKIYKGNSISIINNKLEINKESNEENLLNKCNNNNLKNFDIFLFDNDKKGKNKKIKKKNVSFSFKEYSPSKEESDDNNNNKEKLINFINKIKDIIIKNKINFCFLKLKKNMNIKFKNDRNNCGIYHKINYNDDFNLSKKLKTPKSIQKNDKSTAHYKSKPYNLSSHNSINQFNNKSKISDKNGLKEYSSNNAKKANKLMNKEINIVVHNDKNISNNDNICNNISLSKLKNKFFYMRIKLIKNALKMIKDAL